MPWGWHPILTNVLNYTEIQNKTSTKLRDLNLFLTTRIEAAHLIHPNEQEPEGKSGVGGRQTLLSFWISLCPMFDHSHLAWTQYYSLIFLSGSCSLPVSPTLGSALLCIGKVLEGHWPARFSPTSTQIRINWRAFKDTHCWAPPLGFLIEQT